MRTQIVSMGLRAWLVGCVVVALAGAARAQTTTSTVVTTSTVTSTTVPPGLVHQICFKAKDSLRLHSPDPTWLQVVNTQLGAQNCTIVGGPRYVCMPVTATIVGTVDGSVANGPSVPMDLTPLTTEQLIYQDRLCYKVKCLDRPNINEDTVLYSDEFATRQITHFKAGLVCGPAMQALCGNGVLDYGEDCDDGNNASNDCCNPLCKAEAAGKVSGCADTDNITCTEAACDGAGHCSQTGILSATSKVCTDTDNNPCTVAHCDGLGGCDQSGVLQPTSTPCADTDNNSCTQARCDGLGGCEQLGNVLADNAPCGDTDNNACTRALCSGGSCNQDVPTALGSTCPDDGTDACTTPGCDGAGTCDQEFLLRNCTPLTCNPSNGQCQ
jgi:cysteine-rich repeat protein